MSRMGKRMATDFVSKIVRSRWESIADKKLAIKTALQLLSGRGSFSASWEWIARQQRSVAPGYWSGARLFASFRPDADIDFGVYPEFHELLEKWVDGNQNNNSLDIGRLYAIIMNVRQVMQEGVSGDLAELGVYKGNSAAVLAHYARQFDRRLYLFDTFEGFASEDLIGLDSSREKIFSDTSLAAVQRLVGPRSVDYRVGRFPDTLDATISSKTFSVVHLDCDLYTPMKAALDFFVPRMSPGGLIIMHDYAGVYWDGIKRAVDECIPRFGCHIVIVPDKSGTALCRIGSVGQTRGPSANE